jgi:hypothetical protein
VNHPRDTKDINNGSHGSHEDTYEAELLRRYRWLVCDCIGHKLGSLPDVKNIQVSPPEKYAGEDDIEKFKTWLTGLLCWFRVHNVTGAIRMP